MDTSRGSSPSEGSPAAPPARPRLRVLNLLVIWLAAGLIGVVGFVTWRCTRGVGTITMANSGDRGDWHILEWDSGAMRLLVHERRSTNRDGVIVVVGEQNLVPPSWAYASDRSGPGEPDRVIDTAMGWPWLALRYREEFSAHPSVRVSGGWRLPQTSMLTDLVAQEATIPLTPIPLGLLADVLVIGAAVGVPVGAVRLLRARRFDRRLRRGQCVRCRYDLRSGALKTCPECGSMVPVSAPVSGPRGFASHEPRTTAR